MKYLALMPLTHTQYFTIPSPLSKRNDNYYPLTLFISILWIWAYAYVIVWFTYDISVAVLGSKFSIIPTFIYPIGVSFRDVKKFKDFEIALQIFKSELPDQEISLAESYSPQIFQMTGCAGISWLLFTMATGKKVIFYNDTIQYQVPILIIIILQKYSALVRNRFKTSNDLFKANCYSYVFFVLVVLVIDFRVVLFG